MILADTSVWTDHLRADDSTLSELLGRRMVSMHPLVIGELALGNLEDWVATVAALKALPKAPVAPFDETVELIRSERLMGSGLGWGDLALLASARTTPGTILWTRDRRLADAASRMALGMTG